MVRLHEYQGKSLLSQHGIPVPPGATCSSVEDVRELAGEQGKVVIKAQVWVTGRAELGLIRFAQNAEEAAAAAGELLGRRVDNFVIDQVVVEQQVPVEREFYLGLIVDDRARAPVMILSSVGGTGIEAIAHAHPDRIVRHTVDITTGLRAFEAIEMCRHAGIENALMLKLSALMVRFYQMARSVEARSAEINPLVLTADGDLIALDSRLTIDDYAVFRHPELGIDMAREFDRPPTTLERIAWEVEKNDHRGTFYFIQLETDFKRGERVVGFHGAGGGGSMMNMDALLAGSFRVANFADTSGNPAASKVYRACRIILSQPDIDAYYAGGSGVASQEQFHSARGLVKAFMDAPLHVPAVIRLGGNGEEEAIAILERYSHEFSAPVEAYGRDDSSEYCVTRLQRIVESQSSVSQPPSRQVFEPVDPYEFETPTGGTVTLDHARCRDCESKICVETCVPQILSLEGDVPVLNISRDEARRGGCTECLACEVECYFQGNRGGIISLPIQELE